MHSNFDRHKARKAASPTPSGAGAVEQGDREAAADTYRWFRYGVPRLRERIIAGEMDSDPIVQAFAARRLAGEQAGMEKAAGICQQQERDFLSPEYATNQPLSSIQERFACKACATAILAAAGKDKPNG